MAKLPPISRFSREDFPDAPGWIDKLLTPLNASLGSIYGALNGGLSLTDNLKSQVKTLDVTVFASDPSQAIIEAIYSISGTPSITAGTTNLIAWDTKVSATNGSITAGVFPAPTAGTYLVTACTDLNFGASTSTYDVFLQAFKNGTGHVRGERRQGSTNGLSTSNLAGVAFARQIQLAAGDNLDLRVYYQGSGSPSLEAGTSRIEINFLHA